jgi:hypothetical protein
VSAEEAYRKAAKEEENHHRGHGVHGEFFGERRERAEKI